MHEKKTSLMPLIMACGLVLICSCAPGWRTIITGSAKGVDSAVAVAVDGNGDVVAAGSAMNARTFRDFTVGKFEGASGKELWRREITGTANDNDEAQAVAVDAAGDVVAAGVTKNTGTRQDLAVVKFSGSDGKELWRQEINGTANREDLARAVTVDGDGNVVAAGLTFNNGAGPDFTVVKLSGKDGSDSNASR
jgi:hypothetical protein